MVRTGNHRSGGLIMGYVTTSKATVKALILSDFPTYYNKSEVLQKAIIGLFSTDLEIMFMFMKESEVK